MAKRRRKRRGAKPLKPTPATLAGVRRRVAALADRRRAAGLVRISVWVPAARADEFKRVARHLAETEAIPVDSQES